MMLITGATGNVGRPLVRSLRRDGADVAALTRDPEAVFPAGVRVIVGDPRRPESIPWDGVTGLFVNARAVGDAAASLVAQAKAHGVAKLVVLSAYNVDTPFDLQPSRALGDLNKEVEQAVRTSGLPWVSLRAGVFMVNTIAMWGAQLAEGDVVRGAYPSFVETPVDPADLAEVAAVALRTSDLDGTAPVLTGPQALTLADMAAEVGRGIGRDVRFEEVPPELVRAAMIARGAPRAVVDTMLGRQAHGGDSPEPTGEIERILGRPARSLAQWAADHAAAFGAAAASVSPGGAR